MAEDRSNELIAEQHHHLRALAGRIKQASTRDDIAPLLPELLSSLQVHFAAEEGPGGVMETIQETAPERSRQVEALVGEHRSMLGTVGLLLSEDPAGDFVATAHKVCDELTRHEAEENDLFLEVLETDIGGRG